mgnify:CR=1 FL=1
MTEGTEVQGAAGSPAGSAPAGGASDGAWFDTLPDDLKSDKTVQMFKGKPVVEVVKNLKDAQAYAVGAIRLPTDKDKPEDADRKLADIYTKLGRPESPEKYDLKLPSNLPDGLTVNEELATGFRSWAHKAGLSTKQAQMLMDNFNEFQVGMFTKMGESKATAETALKEQYKGDYEPMMAAAQRLINDFADEQDMTYLESGRGNDPALARLLIKIAGQRKEDKSIKADPATQASTVEKAKARINEILNDPARTDKKHVNHRAINDEYRELFKAAYGNEPMVGDGLTVTG